MNQYMPIVHSAQNTINNAALYGQSAQPTINQMMPNTMHNPIAVLPQAYYNFPYPTQPAAYNFNSQFSPQTGVFNEPLNPSTMPQNAANDQLQTPSNQYIQHNAISSANQYNPYMQMPDAYSSQIPMPSARYPPSFFEMRNFGDPQTMQQGREYCIMNEIITQQCQLAGQSEDMVMVALDTIYQKLLDIRALALEQFPECDELLEYLRVLRQDVQSIHKLVKLATISYRRLGNMEKEREMHQLFDNMVTPSDMQFNNQIAHNHSYLPQVPPLPQQIAIPMPMQSKESDRGKTAASQSQSKRKSDGRKRSASDKQTARKSETGAKKSISMTDLARNSYSGKPKIRRASSTKKSAAGSSKKSMAGKPRKSAAGGPKKSMAGGPRKSAAGGPKKSMAGGPRKSAAGGLKKSMAGGHSKSPTPKKSMAGAAKKSVAGAPKKSMAGGPRKSAAGARKGAVGSPKKSIAGPKKSMTRPKKSMAGPKKSMAGPKKSKAGPKKSMAPKGGGISMYNEPSDYRMSRVNEWANEQSGRSGVTKTRSGWNLLGRSQNRPHVRKRSKSWDPSCALEAHHSISNQLLVTKKQQNEGWVVLGTHRSRAENSIVSTTDEESSAVKEETTTTSSDTSADKPLSDIFSGIYELKPEDADVIYDEIKKYKQRQRRRSRSASIEDVRSNVSDLEAPIESSPLENTDISSTVTKYGTSSVDFSESSLSDYMPHNLSTIESEIESISENITEDDKSSAMSYLSENVPTPSASPMPETSESIQDFYVVRGGQDDKGNDEELDQTRPETSDFYAEDEEEEGDASDDYITSDDIEMGEEEEDYTGVEEETELEQEYDSDMYEESYYNGESIGTEGWDEYIDDSEPYEMQSEIASEYPVGYSYSYASEPYSYPYSLSSYSTYIPRLRSRLSGPGLNMTQLNPVNWYRTTRTGKLVMYPWTGLRIIFVLIFILICLKTSCFIPGSYYTELKHLGYGPLADFLMTMSGSSKVLMPPS